MYIKKFTDNKKNVSTLKQSKKDINRFFILMIILINCKFINTQNATTCFEMFSNKTIQQNCFNTTACCFVQYSFYNNSYVKCIEKLNNTEDICSGMNDITGKEGASLSYCDCFSESFGLSFLTLLIPLLIII